MNSHGLKHRKLTVYFKQAQEEKCKTALIESLLLADGVNNADIDDKQLVVSYSFPEVTAECIMASINQTVGRSAQQPLNRLHNFIRAYMETNERVNLACVSGWHRYVEDVYMHHFDPGMNDKIDIRKQTWRKYK